MKYETRQNYSVISQETGYILKGISDWMGYEKSCLGYGESFLLMWVLVTWVSLV